MSENVKIEILRVIFCKIPESRILFKVKVEVDFFRIQFSYFIYTFIFARKALPRKLSGLYRVQKNEENNKIEKTVPLFCVNFRRNKQNSFLFFTNSVIF